MPIAERDSDYNYYDDLAQLYPQPSQAAAAVSLTSATASSSGLAAAADPPAAAATALAPLGPVGIILLCLIVAFGCLAICALIVLEVCDHLRTRHLYASCARDCTEVVVVLHGEEADDAWQRHKKQREEKEAHGA
jgi:hypothetical protein